MLLHRKTMPRPISPYRSGGVADQLAQTLTPGLLILCLLFGLSAPFGVPGQAALQSASVLVCVARCVLVRPMAMPPWLVCLIGVCCDLLTRQPLGVSSLILLLATAAIAWSRRALAGQGVATAWLVFLPVAIGAALLAWTLIGLLTGRVLPLSAAALQAGFAIGLYPIVALLDGRDAEVVA